MFAWAVSTVLCAFLQAPTAPFQTELPANYPAFQQVDSGQGETWVSLRADETAQLEVRRLEIAAAGALAESIAANLRVGRWQPLLQGVGHEIKEWTGNWASLPAAGHRIDYVTGSDARVIIQRIAVADVYLYIATWEGGLADSPSGSKAIDGINFESKWLPAPAPQQDKTRGMGPLSDVLQPIGHIYARVDASQPDFGTIRFHLRFDPEGGPAPTNKNWRLPASARLIESSELEVSYEVDLYDEEGTPTPSAGMVAGPSCLSGFGVTWLGLPATLASSDGRYASPAVTLTVLSPSFLQTLADVPQAKSWVEDQARVTEFARRRGGGSWPVFAVGYYEIQETSNRNLAVRRSAAAVSSRAALDFLDRSTVTAQGWLPAVQTDWSALTFPGAGDQVMLGLFVFDEGNRWFQDPVDGEWIDGNRRAGLARKLGYFIFGRQLAGRGQGQAFLEASLSEYAAWRILEAGGFTEEADAMVEFWVENEQLAGDLKRPLTLLPWEELTGPRRLMSRGAIVWRALENRAGRAQLDKILNARLAAGGSWTTEDLRKDLEAATEREWLPWFNQHVYGRILP